MIGIVVVLAFPLITLLAFTALFFIYQTRGRWLSKFQRHTFFWYPLMLAAAFGVIASTASGRTGLINVAGTLAANGSVSLWAAVAIVIGGALFVLEKVVATALDRAGPHLPALVGAALDGRTSEMAEIGLSAWAWTLYAIGFVLGEEWLWRGFLLMQLPARFGWSAALALVVSSVAFGSNHYIFGARNVLLKSIEGFVWGALFLASGTILVPILSHFAFALLVGRDLRRRDLNVQPSYTRS
ncbi:MAG: CPBP family intramembrane metalloprotease [Candidatus Dormibacteraeota bacterium]|nr:CPBP family intramembrane metalloprotease [Candidatus Dormibacteraeota bacterium]